LNRKDAQAEIWRLSADRSTLRFTTHALVRDPKSGKHPITERQAALCLQNGRISEGPSPDIKLANGWKFTMHRKGEEADTTVAGVLVPAEKILVITGYETRTAVRRPATPPPPADAGEKGYEPVEK
jgi:hypothetical protein